jgi:hypothetical protein
VKKQGLIKDRCEIDGCPVEDSNLLEFHHIIERTEELTNNHRDNLAILCCNHHSMVHNGRIKLLSVFPSTKGKNRRVLVYSLDGVKNLDIDTVYLEFKPKVFKIR